MPTLTNIVDRVAAWVDENICQKVSLKVPPDLDSPDGSGYEYTLVTPACFPLFVPSSEKLPPKVRAPIPSICVRIIDGEDGRTTGNINFELWFSVWNPGTYGKDILISNGEAPPTYKIWEDEEAKTYFKRNSQGWRDLWNWVDVALREIENAATIDGLQIDMERGIRFGPAKDEEGIPDFYPFWFAYIGFTLNRPIVRNVKDYDELL